MTLNSGRMQARLPAVTANPPSTVDQIAMSAVATTVHLVSEGGTRVYNDSGAGLTQKIGISECLDVEESDDNG